MNKKQNKTLTQDNRAVSPIVGVVLMVAVTVVTAGVMGSFALGMTDKLPDTGNFAVLVTGSDYANLTTYNTTTDGNTTDGNTTDGNTTGENETVPYDVTATASQTGSQTIDITLFNGVDVDQIESMSVSIAGVSFLFGFTQAYPETYLPAFVTDPTPAFFGTITTGMCVTCFDPLNTYITPGEDHVIVTATFLDGTAQIVLDTYV